MQMQIIMQTKEPFSVPFSYNHQLQSAVYSKLSQVGASEHLHDSEFKLFVMGPLKGNYKITDGHLCFTDTVSFELRSPLFDFCDNLQRSLETDPRIKLFDAYLDVSEIRISNRHINREKAVFETVSPVAVRTVMPDKKTIYYSPGDKEFIEGIKRIFREKYTMFYNTVPEEIEIRPLGEHRKNVTRYKKIWITAYSGRYLITGDSRSLEFLYNTGMGIKSAQGFGLLNICE